jgi:hypothetical protein
VVAVEVTVQRLLLVVLVVVELVLVNQPLLVLDLQILAVVAVVVVISLVKTGLPLVAQVLLF